MAALFSAYMSGVAFSGICKNRVSRTVFGSRFYTNLVEIIEFSYSLQAEDEGSIPFTRSNLFDDLEGREAGFVSRRAVVLRH
jgi:hypothetical protein